VPHVVCQSPKPAKGPEALATEIVDVNRNERTLTICAIEFGMCESYGDDAQDTSCVCTRGESQKSHYAGSVWSGCTISDSHSSHSLMIHSNPFGAPNSKHPDQTTILHVRFVVTIPSVIFVRCSGNFSGTPTRCRYPNGHYSLFGFLWLSKTQNVWCPPTPPNEIRS